MGPAGFSGCRCFRRGHAPDRVRWTVQGEPVSLRTYLADPGGDEANARMREKQLGAHRVASTVVCCRLLGSAWKLEVEAIAAA